MKQLLFSVVFLVMGAPIFADDFKVESVIHPVLTKLPPPEIIEGFAKGQMAISTSSDKAAEYVAQGIARLNTSWDFEAYRHFCAAAQLDPDCLMAYWGITISLAGSQHEFFSERENAVLRMLDLMETDQTDGGNRWTQLEKRYAQAAGFLLTDGVRTAGEAFSGISLNYPADIQSKLFSLFLQRDGFDAAGNPRAGQRKADEGLKLMFEANPENISVRSFWVSSQSEAPSNLPFIREEVLPVARKQAADYPDYAPFFLILAHVEGRCGHFAEAIAAASKASELYEVYMKKNKLLFYDCEGWVRAKVFLVSLSAMKGDLDEAMAVAGYLAGVEVDEKRLFSRGAGLLLWEGRTAGARAVMGRSDKASLEKGQKSLDSVSMKQWFNEKSFALKYRDCLGFYLAVRKAIAAKDIKGARVMYDNFLLKIRILGEQEALASKTSSYASWLRAKSTLEIMIPELRGMLTELETGATRLSAKTWYLSATERQGRPSNLLPPTIDYPIEMRLGNFNMGLSQFKEAAENFRKGLELRPNHLATLKGYYQALTKLGEKESAAAIEKQIKAIEK